ncbi:type IV pilin protein [Candidatus Avelusimicrobium stercoris]|uniref:type IV pilin protein n=1 Tax=Candidatus Avelusimicrobium stercoris TaxID=1947924 RepID=UPI003D12FFA2
MKGFTLVEMLVVVLILGILVSVSVPQYQKAVARVKYGNLRSYVEQIYKAEQMYYLANGTFTQNWEELDISFSGFQNGVSGPDGEFYNFSPNPEVFSTYRKDKTELIIGKEPFLMIIGDDDTLPASFQIMFIPWLLDGKGLFVRACYFTAPEVDAQEAKEGAKFCKTIGARQNESEAWIF